MTGATLEITDELLVAYVDEELDSAQAAMVSAALAANPALRRRAEEMCLARDLVREAFPLRAEAPVPAPISAALDRLAEAVATRSRPRNARWPWALAASVVVGVLASVIYLTSGAPGESGASGVNELMRIDPATALHAALESQPSAEITNVRGAEARLAIVLTFKSKDGRFCREFDLDAGAASATGIACREQGNWRTEMLMRRASGSSVASDAYTPAAQDDEPVLAGVVERLMEGDPLSAAEEAQAMATGWRAFDRP